MSSGVGTMAREFALGICHRFNIIQVGGAIKHPEQNKIVDISESFQSTTGVPEPYVRVYPVDGYGDQGLVRYLIENEKIDAVLHFTDPRFWGWLYQMEHEIRQHIPIFYYALWDDLPVPMYNKRFYESCDLIMGISKQSHHIHRKALMEADVKLVDLTLDSIENEMDKFQPETRVSYVPHGINHNYFYPISEDDEEYKDVLEMKKNMVNGKEMDFIVLYNSRNVRRKMTSDVIYAFKAFCDTLTPEQADRCALVMHTQPLDPNGTDLPEVVKELAPDLNIVFSYQKMNTVMMNRIYNVADVTIGIASNEGFGLGTAESVMAGTPTIINVTGGLQDQCGFKDGNRYLTVEDYLGDWGSNHDGRFKNHGEWTKPVWPTNRSIAGSIPTPYIADDRCDWQDAAIRMLEWYNTPVEEREKCGLKGRKWMMKPDVGMTSDEMSHRFIRDMEITLDNWKPRKRYSVVPVENEVRKYTDNGLKLTKKIEEGNIFVPNK